VYYAQVAKDLVQNLMRGFNKYMAFSCFMWLTSSYHEMESGAGIKKSASRIINRLVRMLGIKIFLDSHPDL
jgi:hypothetical protein